MKSVPWGQHCAVRITLHIDFGSVVARQLIGALDTRRSHDVEASHDSHVSDRARADDSAGWDEARRSCVLQEGNRVAKNGQEAAKMACSQCANAVGFSDEADELGHAWETWSNTAAQCWATAGRQRRLHLAGWCCDFSSEACLGETRMPMDCVILEGGGNAELRAWKASGQWVNSMRCVSLKAPSPEHAFFAARKSWMT